MSHIALQRQPSVGGIAGVLGRVTVVFALPLDFKVSFVFVRTIFMPAAPHGAVASLVSVGSLFKSRTAFVRAAWSTRLVVANFDVVLGLLCG